MGKKVDLFVIAIAAAALCGVLFPISGRAADIHSTLNTVGIGILFFLYGSRHSLRNTLGALADFRVHGSITVMTFGIFPLLSLATATLTSSFLPPGLTTGILFIGLLPSTVQSAIAMTVAAKGNVTQAVLTASLSNVLGIVLTPLLAIAVFHQHASIDPLAALTTVLVVVLGPFMAGQLAFSLMGPRWARLATKTSFFDRVPLISVVYASFSLAATSGVWESLTLTVMILLVAILIVLFGTGFLISTWLGRAVKLATQDRRVMQFAGSHKSLVIALPLSAVLFDPSSVSMVILPLMVYHQIQIVLSSILAARFAASATS